jgi:hypothetical protein
MGNALEWVPVRNQSTLGPARLVRTVGPADQSGPAKACPPHRSTCAHAASTRWSMTVWLFFGCTVCNTKMVKNYYRPHE